MTKTYNHHIFHRERQRKAAEVKQPRLDYRLIRCVRCLKHKPVESGKFFSSRKIHRGFICGDCEFIPRVKRSNETKPVTRKLSPAEEEVAKALKDFGWEFIREFELGGASFDFCIPEFKLIVEVDGRTTHRGRRLSRDAVKNDIARRHGYRVLRFTPRRGLAQHVFNTLLSVEIDS